MEFCQKNKDKIIDAYANPEYAEFQTSGTQPFSCRAFYLPSNDHIIQKMITTLENGANNKRSSRAGTKLGLERWLNL